MSATRFNITTEPLGFYHHESDSHPLKSCVVFDNGASARSAMRLLKRIVPDETFETTLLRLEQDLWPAKANISSIAADSDLLVFALASNRELPTFAKAWLDLWTASCDESHECALVALFTGAAPVDYQSPWAEFLKRLAHAANFTFFCGHAQGRREPEFVCATLPEQSLQAPRFAVSDWVVSATPRGTPRSGINE